MTTARIFLLLQVDEPARFMSLGDNVLKACTEIEYVSAMDQLEEYCATRSALGAWLKWWQQRATHVFRAFKSINTPNVNVAEIGHARMQKEGQVNMTLIESCKKDLIFFLKQDTEIKGFELGTSPSGRAPTQQQQDEQSYQRQIAHAKAYIKELHVSPADPKKVPPRKKFVPKTGIHRPTRRDERLLKGKHRGLTAKKGKHTSKEEQEEEEKEQEVEHEQHSTNLKRKRDRDEVDSASAPSENITFTQPYHNNNPFLLLLNPQDGSKKCAGCGIEFQVNAKAPHDMVIQHAERFQYPKDGEYVWSKTSLHKMNYHARETCLFPRHPFFTAARMEVSAETKSKMTDIHTAHLLQNFD